MSTDLNDKTVKELRALATEYEISGRSSWKTKKEIISGISDYQKKPSHSPPPKSPRPHSPPPKSPRPHSPPPKILLSKKLEIISLDEYKKTRKNADGEQPYLIVEDNYLNEQESQKLYDVCLDLPLIDNPTFKIYGRDAVMHRSVGFFSDTSEGYKFSKQTASASPLTPELKKIMKKVNRDLNTAYNGILINVYHNGEDYIGAHSDSEKDLEGESRVAAISLGQERIFRIRGKKEKFLMEVITKNGQLLVMGGSNFQKNYTHEIPAQSSNKVTKPRISLTFRIHTV